MLAERFSGPEEEHIEELQTKIEYYMSDANLRVDKFFHAKIDESQCNGGYISVGYLLKCKRIGTLTKSVPTLLVAIANS